MVQGSHQDGQMCENHSWVTYSYDEHVLIFSSEPHCARNWEHKCEHAQAPVLGVRTVERTGCLPSIPKGPSWAEGWSLWDSIQPEKNIATGVYRQWHGWLNHPGSTAANMLEESLREPETRSGGFTYLGWGRGTPQIGSKPWPGGDLTANTMTPQSQSSCC